MDAWESPKNINESKADSLCEALDLLYTPRQLLPSEIYTVIKRLWDSAFEAGKKSASLDTQLILTTHENMSQSLNDKMEAARNDE